MNFQFEYATDEKYFRLIDFIIGKIFRKYSDQKGWTVLDLSKSDNTHLLYKGVKAELENTLGQRARNEGLWKDMSFEAGKTIFTILENFDVVKQKHISYLEAYGNSETLNQTYIKSIEDCFIPKTLRLIFRILPKARYDFTKKEFYIPLDKDGIPFMADAGKLWFYLKNLNHFGGDIKRFEQLLTQIHLKERVPELEYLNQLLKIGRDNRMMSPSEKKQFLVFYEAIFDIKPYEELKADFESDKYNHYRKPTAPTRPPLGFLKIKNVERCISIKQNDQEYEVVVFETVTYENGKWIDVGIKAERAFFPDWSVNKYLSSDQLGEASSHSNYKTETYRGDVFYDSLKKGDIVEGNIISFIIIFLSGNERSEQIMKYVLLDNFENPLRKIVKKINKFPVHIIDYYGRVFRIASKDNIPSWPY